MNEHLNAISTWLALSASMIRSGEDFTPRAEAAFQAAKDGLAALSTNPGAGVAAPEGGGVEEVKARVLAAVEAGDYPHRKPTHWMPLPNPPETGT